VFILNIILPVIENLVTYFYQSSYFRKYRNYNTAQHVYHFKKNISKITLYLYHLLNIALRIFYISIFQYKIKITTHIVKTQVNRNY